MSSKICSRKILRSFDVWFFLFVVCAAVVLRYLVVRFLFLALVLFASCSVCAVLFSVACVPLVAPFSSSLFFSSSHPSPFGGRPGRGPLSLLRSFPCCAEATMSPLQACACTWLHALLAPLSPSRRPPPPSPSSRPASSPSRRLLLFLFFPPLSLSFFLPLFFSVVLLFSVCMDYCDVLA